MFCVRLSILIFFPPIDNSDLNLVIDASKYSAHPLTNEGFAFMWAGVRATHGAAKGKFCFEVKVLMLFI